MDLIMFTMNRSHVVISKLSILRLFNESHAISDRWLSVEEIAEYLGVSKDTVYAWISKHNMPAHRIGRFWKFKTEKVGDWVRSGVSAKNESRDND